ncbi:isocitrate lyase/PEP mutase family protein [Aquibaculum arenosum]|uniref:Isocitrate lyase/phosphoenolpyruvate mutase family protein n=1 Tax=Aquibaculum arenosum TaxID=3032591 RepID=A0ABT5YQE9_9PROT|nr:isocitrate lyase/phosphoenolpyruvate mutase family protein [Fodinicurvata sp. CAU 1616]MDF2097124.1 isocitrate lyase/phosphoenolpyruvate mutase family protein [Fodinicurvata sp. CAU 1616]
MRPTIAQKRETFRRLHEGGCFVMPNPWDVGSALALQDLGFEALASTSAGMAWAHGRPDTGVDLETDLSHLRALVEAVDLPVNADFEGGYAVAPEGVAANVRRAVDTGVAGLSIEDSTGDPQAPLYDFDLAVQRVAAARAAIDSAGGEVLLTARSEGFIAGRPDLDETLRRLTTFARAGADCLFAPGLREAGDIEAVVRAVAPKPVNVLTLGQPVAELAELGVRRISVGGSLARTAWGAFLKAAREVAGQGTFQAFEDAAPSAELNALFDGRNGESL